MKRRPALTAVGLAAVLALVATPVLAQHHRGGGDSRHDSAAPRADHQDHQAPASQPSQQQAVPRSVAPQYQPHYDSGRYYSGRYYGPRYVGPTFSIAPRRYFRPYYVFRPRFSIGFGIWAGYPITYYDPYYYPYDYYPYAVPPPPAYPPPAGSVSVQPYPSGQTNMGGVSFEITPNTAEVWVDGTYYGTVGQFTPSSQPLGLPAGRHHVELREPGYQVTSIDVDIVAGQVIPYQGQLQP